MRTRSRFRKGFSTRILDVQQRTHSHGHDSSGMWYNPYCGQPLICAMIRSLDHTPMCTVPVLDQIVIPRPDGPDIIRRASCHTCKIITTIARSWTGDDTPPRAIPVYDQRLIYY